MRWNLILYKTGFSFFFFGLLLLLPLGLDIFWEEGYWKNYVMMIAFLFFFGTSLILSNQGALRPLNLKETFVIIILVVITACVTGALPFYSIIADYTLTDSMFESISSLTTTAATLIKEYDVPQSLFLWKGILQFIGGIGCLIYVMIFLPILKIGGMHIYNAGGVNLSGKLLPNSMLVIWQITKAYLCLAIACFLALSFAGMSIFDAVIHAMSAVSTSGFSPYKDSIGHFGSFAIEAVILLFTFLSALPFLIIVSYFQRSKSLELKKDPQVPYFLGTILVFWALFFLWMVLAEDLSVLFSLRHSLFLALSGLTTSGFFITNIGLLIPFTALLLIFAIYIGGCAGSTAGGAKVMRILVVAKIMYANFKKLRFRNAVFAVKYGKRVVDSDLIRNVMGFLCLYVLTNVIISLALALAGMDFISSISIAASSIANYGLAFGDTTATFGEYNFLPDGAKWVVMAGMLLGRMEIVAFFVLLNVQYTLRKIPK